MEKAKQQEIGKELEEIYLCVEKNDISIRYMQYIIYIPACRGIRLNITLRNEILAYGHTVSRSNFSSNALRCRYITDKY